MEEEEEEKEVDVDEEAMLYFTKRGRECKTSTRLASADSEIDCRIEDGCTIFFHDPCKLHEVYIPATAPRQRALLYCTEARPRCILNLLLIFSFSCSTFSLHIPKAQMDPSKVLSLLEQLDDEVDDLEEALAPLLKTAMAETSSKLPLLDKAKLYTLMTYAIESLLFCK